MKVSESVSHFNRLRSRRSRRLQLLLDLDEAKLVTRALKQQELQALSKKIDHPRHMWNSQIIDTLLRAPLDFYVRFTSRSHDRADRALRYFAERYGPRVQAIVIPNIEADGAYDEAVKGVSGIIDLASPSRISDVSLTSLVNSAVRSTESLLSSASKEASVKRVVHCSSVLSAGHGNAASFEDVLNGSVRAKYLNSKSWNKEAENWSPESELETQDHTESETLTQGDRTPLQIDEESRDAELAQKRSNAEETKCEDFAKKFGIMKCKAEKAAFRFVRDHQPNFTLTSVLPAVVFGQVLSSSKSVSTSGWLLQFHTQAQPLLNPSRSNYYSSAFCQLGCPIKNNFPPQSFVDVSDLSLLFYSVLVTPSLEPNERIFASTSSFSWNDVLKVLDELNPGLRSNTTGEKFEYLKGKRDRVDHTVIDNGRFLELLEIKGARANCLFQSVKNTMRG